MSNEEAINDLSVLAERMDSKSNEIYVADISLVSVDMAIKALEERKTGRWKAKDFHTCYCTNCNFAFDIMRCDFMDKMRFCPNCGANMVADKEGEE